MADWLSSMQRTYEYYTVDPLTWKDLKRIDTVTSSSITRDLSNATLGSATIDVDENVDETYIRIYLITIQNGVTEKHPLGTYLAQTPSEKFDGKNRMISLDAYTPLIELTENQPPLGYYVEKNSNVMERGLRLTQDHLRAPVVGTTSSKKVYDHFVANTDDTWLTFIKDLIATDNYMYGLDDLGRIIFLPIQNVSEMSPTWIYDDGNSSILYPDLSTTEDYFGVPNVVEVIYQYENGGRYEGIAENRSINSKTSIQNRGRKIVKRITDPKFSGVPSEAMVREYAEQQLDKLSTIKNKITYTHGFNGVNIGDCIMLNYSRAGKTGIKARVVSQTITCDSTCKVRETAEYETNLWR